MSEIPSKHSESHEDANSRQDMSCGFTLSKSGYSSYKKKDRIDERNDEVSNMGIEL